MPDDDKRRPLGDHVRHAVRRYRDELRLPYTELSQRLAKLGRPIPVLGLRRLEAGDRRVDVDDLAALSRALGVPPVLLLFPLGQEDAVEVLPGVTVDVMEALDWFAGENPFGGEALLYPDVTLDEDSEFDLAGYNRRGQLVRLFRDHRDRVQRWIDLNSQAVVARQRAARAATEAERIALLAEATNHDRLARAVERMVRTIRNQIRSYGASPPTLPPGLADIDQQPAGGSDEEN